MKTPNPAGLRLTAILLVGVLLAVLGRVLYPRGDEPSRGALPNIILVSMDTLRADRLGCYGYALDSTPWIDRFCGDSIVFERAMAHAPSTLPSHASIFTSLLPLHHGASYRLSSPLGDGFQTLAEVLAEAGYETAAFTGAGQVASMWGLDQGFGVYDELPGGSFAEIVEKALTWLRRPRWSPFFLFLHTYEAHHPYTPEEWRLARLEGDYSGPLPNHILIQEHLVEINRGELEVSADDVEHISRAYDAEVHSMDEAFGRLIEELTAAGLYDPAVLVLTSDHGEEFGEHGSVGWHSHTLFEELLHVPLVVKLPGLEHAGSRITSIVRSIDIAPTVLAAAGLPAPETFDGVDLLELAREDASPSLPVVSMIEPETRHAVAQRSFSKSLRLGDWKLIDGRLFDLAADPAEEVDVAALHPAVVSSLKSELSRQMDRREPASSEGVELDEATTKQLKALGYLP